MWPGLLLQAGMEIINKFFPDPAAKAAAQLEFLKLQQAGEFKALEADLQMAQGQMDSNKVEAASANVFVSGWRPFIGWTCGAAFAINFIVGPLAQWLAALNGHVVAFPSLDVATMLPVLFGMLGLGAYRTAEKIKGVA